MSGPDRDPAGADGDGSGDSSGDGADLAVVVEKPRAEVAIASLRAEGVYDDRRRVREFDAETVALPVTIPPSATAVREVIRQVEPTVRSPDLADLLAERGWSESAVASAPQSWAVIGSVILVSVPDDCPDETALGEALLELHGEAETVLADEGVATAGEPGRFREPRTRHLVGDRDTETVHTEAGTRYGLDPARVMFSPGNQAERIRMSEAVSPGEHVFDMFAGIGYFTLPMARSGATVAAAEVNPAAVRYLLENAVSNDVADRVDVYPTDCRDVAGDIAADRVVMGYYGSGGDPDDEAAVRTDEAHVFLPAALAALEPGGVLHYHEATPEPRLWERPLERLETAVADVGREFEVREKRRVKSHSPGVAHVAIDAVVR